MRTGKIKIALGALAVAGMTLISPCRVEASPQVMPDGTVFDAAFYAMTYPDVLASVGSSDVNSMYNHYVRYGKKEGRLPVAPGYKTTGKSSVTSSSSSSDGNSSTSTKTTITTLNESVTNTKDLDYTFDATYYAKKYPDVVKVFGNSPRALYTHYNIYGAKEGRYPNEKVENAVKKSTESSLGLSSGRISMDSAAKELFNLINAERAQIGLHKLTWNESVATSARLRTRELSVKFSNQRTNGTGFYTALSSSLQSRGSGESICMGYEKPQQVLQDWYWSAANMDNMLDQYFVLCGIGCYYDGNDYYWSAIFVE